MYIFVTNFSSKITCSKLEKQFRHYGEVETVTIWVDRGADEPRRFAIVEMEDDDKGERAVERLHTKVISGDKWWVEEMPDGFAHMLDLCHEAEEILKRQAQLLWGDD